MARRKKRPGANSIGAMTPEGWHTRADAAKQLGLHPDTLKAWHRKAVRGDDHYTPATPSGTMKAGMLDVWLYSDKDIEVLREFSANQKPGRRPKAVTVA